MSDDGEFTIDELVDYCETQARLLHGQVETLDDETATLLSELDDELSDVRSQLDEHGSATAAESPQGPEPGPGGDVADLESLEANLTEKQAAVEAKQTRRDAIEEVAIEYLELAEGLQIDTPAPSVALKRVMQFEYETDVSTYFADRVTLLEAATDGDDGDE
jgi:hypothetical protein